MAKWLFEGTRLQPRRPQPTIMLALAPEGICGWPSAPQSLANWWPTFAAVANVGSANNKIFMEVMDGSENYDSSEWSL